MQLLDKAVSRVRSHQFMTNEEKTLVEEWFREFETAYCHDTTLSVLPYFRALHHTLKDRINFEEVNCFWLRAVEDWPEEIREAVFQSIEWSPTKGNLPYSWNWYIGKKPSSSRWETTLMSRVRGILGYTRTPSPLWTIQDSRTRTVRRTSSGANPETFPQPETFHSFRFLPP